MMRLEDTVARYGGEEFIVLLPKTDLERAGIVAERLRGIIENSGIPLGESTVYLTVSIGVAGREGG